MARWPVTVVPYATSAATESLSHSPSAARCRGPGPSGPGRHSCRHRSWNRQAPGRPRPGLTVLHRNAGAAAASIGFLSGTCFARVAGTLGRIHQTAASGYLQQSRLTRSGYPTLLLWNAKSHADHRDHGCPSAGAMQHSRHRQRPDRLIGSGASRDPDSSKHGAAARRHRPDCRNRTIAVAPGRRRTVSSRLSGDGVGPAAALGEERATRRSHPVHPARHSRDCHDCGYRGRVAVRTSPIFRMKKR